MCQDELWRCSQRSIQCLQDHGKTSKIIDENNYFLHVSIYLRFFQPFQGLWNKDGKLILSKVKPVLKKLRTDKDSDVQYFAQVRVLFFVYHYYSNFASLKKLMFFNAYVGQRALQTELTRHPRMVSMPFFIKLLDPTLPREMCLNVLRLKIMRKIGRLGRACVERISGVSFRFE